MIQGTHTSTLLARAAPLPPGWTATRDDDEEQALPPQAGLPPQEPTPEPKKKKKKKKKPAGTPSATAEAWQAEMLAAVNAERARAGVAALCLNAKLSASAQAHIEDKVRSKFAGDPHVGSDGSKAWDRARRAGYKDGFIGENIAAGTPSIAEAMAGWMDSPPHRANIVRDGFLHLGVGLTAGKFWAQEFGSSAAERCD